MLLVLESGISEEQKNRIRSTLFLFYADIEADVHADAMAPVMSALRDRAEYLRVLGAY